MKKKFLGRASAIGLAGLTAFSAMSIVASAEISVSNQKDKDGYTIITGSAKKITWNVEKVVHTHTYDEITGKISNSEVITRITDNPSTYIGGGSSGYLLSATKYYRYDSNATTTPDDIRTAVNNGSKSYKEAYASFEAECADYTFYSNWFQKSSESGAYTLKSGAGKDTVVYYGNIAAATDPKANYQFYTITKNADGTTTKSEYSAGIFNNSTKTAAPTWAGDTTEYRFVTGGTPAVSTIDVSVLARELNSYYVVFKSDNSIEAADTGKDAKDDTYVITTMAPAGSTGNAGNTTNGVYYGNIPAAYWYPDANGYVYKSNVTGLCYPNEPAIKAVEPTASYGRYTPAQGYTAVYSYFDVYNGTYRSYAYVSTNNIFSQVIPVSGTVTSAAQTELAVYKVSTTGLYYHTWSSAYTAANQDASKITLQYTYEIAGNYFSRLTGFFYSTYDAAYSASNGNAAYIVTINGSGYFYDDPYYYYFLAKQGSGSSSSSSSNLGGSSVTIGNKSGWSNVQNSIKKAAAGATLNVSLGNETSIPSEILTALNGKNVTVNFTLKNGSVITFNGQNISSPKNVNVNVAYNTTSIPSALIKKAKSVTKASSSAQVTISSNTFGGSASLTVKFNTNRSGYTAKIYRYNSSRNSLQLVDTSTVASSGKVTFDKITQGGEYVITLTK